ncbi:OPT/YSL family transporter [Hyalangium minutum]|uniref:OPT/YSL family transporter n=1 Tax=Hyalangium minutum TaxID=394096 RepID=UPI00146FFF06|nr:OPT/YSL family transporter [Hyalangium minutum]
MTQPSEAFVEPIPATELALREQLPFAEKPRPVPQLTPRALAWGAVLGCLLGVSNVYLGLLIGVGISVGLTAALIAIPMQRGLAGVAPGWLGREFSLLESCVLQTTASGAGYAVISSLPSVAVAWVLTQGAPVSPARLVAWTLCTSLLGLCFGLLLQRRFLAREELAFPFSVGAAATLRAAQDRPRSSPQARALLASVSGATLVGVSRDILKWVPGMWVPPGSLVMVGVGALMGPRLAVSMLLGWAACFGWLVPALIERGVAESAEAAAPLHTAWAGSVLLVSAVLVHTLRAGVSMLRSLRLRAAAPPAPLEALDALEPPPVPRAVLWAGTGLLALASVAMASLGLGVSWALGLLAVGVSLALTAFTCRVMAETGSPPDVAVNQMASGLLLRGGLMANLVHSSLVFNTSAVGTDLLANLKTAKLLGAGARQQLVAQGVGCTLGVLVLVPIFCLLVPDASAVSGEAARFPGVAGQQVRTLAVLLEQGVGSLPPLQLWSVLLAAVAGVTLALAETLVPRQWHRFIPSALGLGLAFLLPFEVSVVACICIGGVLRWAVPRWRPEAEEQWVLPAACGLISAESLLLVFGTILAAMWAS